MDSGDQTQGLVINTVQLNYTHILPLLLYENDLKCYSVLMSLVYLSKIFHIGKAFLKVPRIKKKRYQER